MNTFLRNKEGYLYLPVHMEKTDTVLTRRYDSMPFVPSDEAKRNHRCDEILSIQSFGLKKRYQHIGCKTAVVGISGGLDSTLALLVTVRTFDMLGLPRENIHSVTMPCFGTTLRTRSNAEILCDELAVSFTEIDIANTVHSHFRDIGQDESVLDVTFENGQARVRTLELMDTANRTGGLVVGTGDLSELALGWCTYGVGDQMSHYAVNTGVPKTLMQHLIRWVVASKQFDDRVGEVLLSILHTEISPELVPAKPGEKMQSTQDKIGPYNLQDFTLYHVLRRGARPSKIAFLAEKAWSDASVGSWPVGFPEEDKVAYSLEEIVKWERLFLWRFFSQQFKRSALPNGPKVMAGGSLSPRGDWRMPSDVSGADWVAELDEAVKGLVD